MRISNHRTAGFLAALCLTLLTASCAREEAPVYAIGTGGLTGNYSNVGIALRRILFEDPMAGQMRFEDRISSGSAANIDGLISGDLQFGIAQADHQYQAINGTGDWAGKGPQSDLRALFNLYIESVALVTGLDTEISSMQDLRGKKVDIGAPGSGTRTNAIAALQAAGLDWQTDIIAFGESADDRLAKFMSGDIDAFFYTAGHPNKEIKFATFSVRGVRLVPLENVEALLSASPFYSSALIPSDTYPRAANNIDIKTVGINATLVTSAQVPEDVVYELTKAVFKNVENSTEFRNEFGALYGNAYLDGLTAPIHPGAQRYFLEAGIEIPGS